MRVFSYNTLYNSRKGLIDEWVKEQEQKSSQPPAKKARKPNFVAPTPYDLSEKGSLLLLGQLATYGVGIVPAFTPPTEETMARNLDFLRDLITDDPHTIGPAAGISTGDLCSFITPCKYSLVG